MILELKIYKDCFSWIYDNPETGAREVFSPCWAEVFERLITIFSSRGRIRMLR